MAEPTIVDEYDGFAPYLDAGLHRPRPYQDAAIKKSLGYGENEAGPPNRLVVGPTGSGKTVMFATTAILAIARGWPAWIIAHGNDLMGQHCKVLDSFGVPYGTIWGSDSERKPDPAKLLQVVSLATWRDRTKPASDGDMRALGEAGYPRPRLILADEIHEQFGGPIDDDGEAVRDGTDFFSWVYALRRRHGANALPLIGYTATPFQQWFPRHFAPRGVVHVGSIAELTRDGWLAPVRVVTPALLDSEAFAARHGIDIASHVMASGEYRPEFLASQIGPEVSTGIYCRWQDYCALILGRWPQPTMVFVPTQPTAAAMSVGRTVKGEPLPTDSPFYGYAPWNGRPGAPGRPLRADWVGNARGATVNKRITKEFTDGHLDVLFAVNKLGVGFDYPGLMCGIDLRERKGGQQRWVQNMGRLQRPDPASGKTMALWIDAAANMARHGTWWAKYVHGDFEIGEIAKSKATTSEPQPSREGARTWTCPRFGQGGCDAAVNPVIDERGRQVLECEGFVDGAPCREPRPDRRCVCGHVHDHGKWSVCEGCERRRDSPGSTNAEASQFQERDGLMFELDVLGGEWQPGAVGTPSVAEVFGPGGTFDDEPERWLYGLILEHQLTHHNSDKPPEQPAWAKWAAMALTDDQALRRAHDQEHNERRSQWLEAGLEWSDGDERKINFRTVKVPYARSHTQDERDAKLAAVSAKIDSLGPAAAALRTVVAAQIAREDRDWKNLRGRIKTELAAIALREVLPAQVERLVAAADDWLARIDSQIEGLDARGAQGRSPAEVRRHLDHAIAQASRSADMAMDAAERSCDSGLCDKARASLAQIAAVEAKADAAIGRHAPERPLDPRPTGIAAVTEYHDQLLEDWCPDD